MVKGRLILSNSDHSGMGVLKFVIPASADKPEAKGPFYEAKLAHYNQLVARDIPGGAWFRHQARVVANGDEPLTRRATAALSAGVAAR